jgi:hypothetical protein
VVQPNDAGPSDGGNPDGSSDAGCPDASLLGGIVMQPPDDAGCSIWYPGIVLRKLDEHE